MKIPAAIKTLLRKRRLEAEMAEELREHIALRAERNVEAGMSVEEAEQQARRSFGGTEQIKERCRDERGGLWLQQLVQDLRYSLVGLRNRPSFALVAVIALALGIGANTAIFSVVNAVLLRPLPFPEQKRLVALNESTEQQPNLSLSFPNFVDWRSRQGTFAALGVARSQSFNDAAPGGAERLSGAQASHDYFTALGVSVLRGRLFYADDDKPGAAPSVIVRESYWKRRLGGRETALGETIQLSGVSHAVIGIVSDDIQWPGRVEVWVPLGLSVDHPSYQNRGNHPGLYAVGRLKPGVALETARADLRVIAGQLAREYPGSNAGHSVAMQTLADRVFGNVAPMLWLLLGAAGFVLLIACANVANLQLARAQARGREFALRMALGAGRGRLVRQVLAESLLLGAFGCIAGLILGAWSLAALRSFLPVNLPRVDQIGLGGGVLAVTSCVCLLTTAAFGLLPALNASKLDLRQALATGARAVSSNDRWRALLIVGEFALTCILLVGAILMLRTLGNLYRADSGFSTEQVVTFNWALPGTTTYADASKRVAAIDRALSRIAAIPGVSQAGVVSPLPLGGTGNNGAFYVEGAPASAVGESPWCERAHVSGGYFSTLGIPLKAGRTFDERDVLAGAKTAIVDSTFADRYFPNGAVGQRFAYGNKPPRSESDWHHIVGVVAHIQNGGPGVPTRLQTYVPFTQMPPVTMSFAVSTALSPAALAPSLRLAMRDVDAELPIYGESTLDALFEANIATPRLTSLLLGAFAALGLTLSAVGLYGVLSFLVGQRTQEIGVRLALGANPADVIRLVLRQGVKLAGFGLVLGMLAASALSQLLARVLYDVTPLDPSSFAVVAAILVGVGVLACWLPAWRASKIPPTIALRTE